jgi:ribosomal protein S18 acetylase RimI-like enzyme
MASWTHHEYAIEEGASHIDWPRVHTWLASSYWSPGISRERVERAARHSALLLSAFKEGQQVAYLRVISDQTRFAYLCDIWVDTAHRRRGLARAMVRCALEHPDFLTVAWMLATTDAHAVYVPFGFKPLVKPEYFMRRSPTAT